MRIFLFFSWLKGGGKRRKETAEGYGRGVREKAGEREGRGDEKQVDARGWLEKRKTLHTEEGLARRLPRHSCRRSASLFSPSSPPLVFVKR